MDSGYISIFPIFEFITKHPKIVGGKNRGFRQYSLLCDELVRGVPKQSGWYFWGKFNKKSNWDCIYVGKSEKTVRGQGSLYYRIRYEVKTERIAFWAYVIGDKKAFTDHSRAFNKKYDDGTRRAIKKRGAHFIIWVSDPTVSGEQINNEEKSLIAYYKPSIQRKSLRGLTSKTREIIKLVSAEVDKILNHKQ